jgi:hypothetical protein
MMRSELNQHFNLIILLSAGRFSTVFLFQDFFPQEIHRHSHDTTGEQEYTSHTSGRWPAAFLLLLVSAVIVIPAVIVRGT